jgi:hypothetical protein
VRPRGHNPASARTRAASARMHSFQTSPPPSPTETVCCPRGWTASVQTRTQKKFKNLKILYFYFYFLRSCCRNEKREKNFGFQSPRSPRSPSSVGFTREAARRRFFRPSSPSHPSKLYSSLGWLNSKVPKPFSPFSLRLIDVDGF